MKKRYFGTDGVRGRVGTAPMTPDFVLKLAYAAGLVLRRQRSRPRLLIGKDTRISGYMFEAAMEAGFSAAGVDILLAGPLPTPAIAYLVRTFHLDGGVVISASHNPYDDNGIKFLSASGGKLDDAWEAEVEALLDQPISTVPSPDLGRAERLDDATGRYVEFCKSTFPAALSLRGLKLVVDCANGAAYRAAPLVLRELGAEVIAVANHPNGLNINDGVGATAPAFLQQQVVEHQAQLGIALDGDGDRLIMVTAEDTFDGDALLFAIVKDRLDTGHQVPGVVGTVMTNQGLERALERRGIPLVRTAVGDRYVLEVLQQRGWRWGGENSGHILCLDRHSTGDGLIAALQVLAALVRQGSSLANWLEEYQRFPQCLINLPLPPGSDPKALLNNPTVSAAQTEVENILGKNGRVLLRPSGTEAKLRVMVEAQDAALAQQCAERLVAAINGLK